MRSTSENFDVFNSRDDIYLVFTSKKVNFLFILFFVEDLRLINNIKEDKGLFVTEYLDQSLVIGTFR